MNLEQTADTCRFDTRRIYTENNWQWSVEKSEFQSDTLTVLRLCKDYRYV